MIEPIVCFLLFLFGGTVILTAFLPGVPVCGRCEAPMPNGYHCVHNGVCICRECGIDLNLPHWEDKE